MSMFRIGLLFLLAIAYCVMPSVCRAQGPNLGRPLTPDEIRKADITVSTDGRGLPPGSGSVSAGAAVYTKYCQSCHGAQAAGKPQDQLTRAAATLPSSTPVNTPSTIFPPPT